MKTLEIKGSTGISRIMVGESISNLKQYLPVERYVIITDTNVEALYRSEFPLCPVICIGQSENIKTLDTVRDIYQQLLEFEADRSSMIVGIGGGIVCDIAGFAASTYLRGVRFGFVSTTLLAQVDASVGGKNGVNFSGYKNMVGVFNQPEFVLCDTDMLKTLPDRELLCGFAEIIKHALIADEHLFSYLEQHYHQALRLERNSIERAVYDSVVIKSSIVNQDEREAGERRKLNFGHTFGHAIEKTVGLPHGEAVSIGMAAAVQLSVAKGLLPKSEGQRIQALIHNFGLPLKIQTQPAHIIDALRKDKKREGDKIHFILLEAIGRAIITEISLTELNRAVQEMD